MKEFAHSMGKIIESLISNNQNGHCSSSLSTYSNSTYTNKAKTVREPKKKSLSNMLRESTEAKRMVQDALNDIQNLVNP